jgi:hypothetical protein
MLGIGKVVSLALIVAAVLTVAPALSLEAFESD